MPRGSGRSVMHATTVHALWTDDRRAPGGTANDVFYRRSVDGGLSFEPEVSIDRGEKRSDFAQIPI